MKKTPKNTVVFSCDHCYYITSDVNEFETHSSKHKLDGNALEMKNAQQNTEDHDSTNPNDNRCDFHNQTITNSPHNPNGIENTQKTLKGYSCNLCDFHTGHYGCFKRHSVTRKHRENEANAKNPERKERVHTCNVCSKTYNTQSGLWKHKKTCVAVEKPSENLVTVELLLEIIKQNQICQENQVSLTKGVVESNKDLQNFVINKLSEVTAQTINNNTNTNSHNRTFNLNVFLNEHCKDAINLTDFANALNVTVRDLERTGQLGFVGGITQIIADGLNELDVHTRPIHCTDLKRETVYVKEDGKWIKDEPKDGKDLPRFRTAVKKVANKNLLQLHTWMDENPRCEDTNSDENETYLHLSKHAMGGRNGEEEAKFENTILKNVMKKVTIDKDGLTVA